jgi:hypothetical protein
MVTIFRAHAFHTGIGSDIREATPSFPLCEILANAGAVFAKFSFGVSDSHF